MDKCMRCQGDYFEGDNLYKGPSCEEEPVCMLPRLPTRAQWSRRAATVLPSATHLSITYPFFYESWSGLPTHQSAPLPPPPVPAPDKGVEASQTNHKYSKCGHASCNEIQPNMNARL
ncbi:hypothetical protein O3P69_004772 [Scylla paramamosain]|uniref:Uncharacterized protein n=1 Tax=Scylla paramamosain TaxID=85552 RepID=A0AAW0UC89_SCYPA